jgi:hypothetical protein
MGPRACRLPRQPPAGSWAHGRRLCQEASEKPKSGQARARRISPARTTSGHDFSRLSVERLTIVRSPQIDAGSSLAGPGRYPPDRREFRSFIRDVRGTLKPVDEKSGPLIGFHAVGGSLTHLERTIAFRPLLRKFHPRNELVRITSR